MDPERFRNSPSGRLLKVGQGETAYWGFIPNPLPPPLSLETVLVNALSDADRALGELSGLGRTMPKPHLLIAPFIRREAVLSSKIEGTLSTIADSMLLKPVNCLCLPIRSRLRKKRTLRRWVIMFGPWSMAWTGCIPYRYVCA